MSTKTYNLRDCVPSRGTAAPIRGGTARPGRAHREPPPLTRNLAHAGTPLVAALPEVEAPKIGGLPDSAVRARLAAISAAMADARARPEPRYAPPPPSPDLKAIVAGYVREWKRARRKAVAG